MRTGSSMTELSARAAGVAFSAGAATSISAASRTISMPSPRRRSSTRSISSGWMISAGMKSFSSSRAIFPPRSRACAMICSM